MKKKLYVNTIVSLFYQIFNVIVGLVLPRLFLISYGSKVNGLIQSITQMLSIITLMDLGVGAVVQASLYKPLVEKDNDQVSILYSSAKKYFKIIARILVVYIFLLMLFYSYFKSNDFNWFFSCTLIFSISISSFAQYYFSICNSILLNADQKIYVPTFINLITLILNAIITICLINFEFSIQYVKLMSSLIFLIRPICLSYYVNKKYQIKVIKNPPKNAIKNKWSGLTQHIATVLTTSIDSMVLTFLSTFQSVSIYNIYVMPLNAIRTLLETLTMSYKSYFGNLIALEDNNKLEKEFNKYETIVHFFTVVIFGVISIVLVPFVSIYTQGVNDTNYENYLFSYLITLSYAIYSLRLPYTTLIFSAGKFRETQIYSIIECIINIVLSVLLVNFFGIIGVAIATCIAVGYRTILSAYYLKKDIIKRNFTIFIKHIVVDVVCVFFIIIVSTFFQINNDNLILWFINSLSVFLLSLIVCIVIHILFYKEEILEILKKF